MRIIELTEEARTNILENLLKRSPNSYGEFEGRVNEIIENVRANRDAAIFDYTKRFDGADINAENILVTEDEIKEAYEKVDEKLLTVIRKALVNIRKYHEKQRQYSWFDSEESGIILGQKVTALEKVGVYVPGGKAVYPSSVLMNIVPAKVAGVKTIVMTTSRDLAEQVSKEVEGFVAQLSRKEIIQKSLDNYGYILVAESMDEAIATVNEIASEHLELVTKNPFETMTKIRNAGAIFVGEYSSEPLGDYFAGPNHVLPTNGTAKFFSPLSVDDFIKKSSIISYSREALEPIYKDIVQFAECEQLTAHANSIRVRFED